MEDHQPPPKRGWVTSLPSGCFWRKTSSASANANPHSPTEAPAQMINRGLEVFPPANYILELHFLFLGSPVSHLLPRSTFAASGCRNWLGSKANWRSKMILYWLFFFNKREVASRETCSHTLSLTFVRGISRFLYFLGTNQGYPWFLSVAHRWNPPVVAYFKGMNKEATGAIGLVFDSPSPPWEQDTGHQRDEMGRVQKRKRGRALQQTFPVLLRHDRVKLCLFVLWYVLWNNLLRLTVGWNSYYKANSVFISSFSFTSKNSPFYLFCWKWGGYMWRHTCRRQERSRQALVFSFDHVLGSHPSHVLPFSTESSCQSSLTPLCIFPVWVWRRSQRFFSSLYSFSSTSTNS